MAKTEPDLTITKAWQDLTATYAGMAGVSSYIQNKSFNTDRHMLVVFSASATAPTGPTGLRVPPGEIAQGTAAHVWVRAFREDVLINCGTAD